MFVKILKNMIPAAAKAYIRLGASRTKYRKRIAAMSSAAEPFDILIGTALHTNLGDHLIALAEKEFIPERSGRALIEIPREAYHLYRNKISGIALPEDTTVYITGGGWMGDLWPNEEKDVQDMASLFRKQKIVILPQTIFYEDPESRLINRGNKIYAKCTEIKLCVREQSSYDRAEASLHIKNISLTPDIALLYTYRSNRTPRSMCAGICLRRDREQVLDAATESKLLETVRNAGYKTVLVSTMSDHRISEEERKAAVNKALDEFASCSLLIVDRLHAMVFAYLTGRPCIALDNKTGKVSGVYRKWLYDCPYIMLADSTTKSEDIAAFIAQTKGISYQPKNFTSYFNEIIPKGE